MTRLRPDGPGRPAVSRPRGIPSLITDIEQIDTYGPDAQEMYSIRATEVCLAVGDLDAAVGAEHLSAWTQRVVVAVTAGASSVERVRTAGGLVHAAGLELWCSMLLRTEATDESSGIPPIGMSTEAGA
jgi:hypothetical protein